MSVACNTLERPVAEKRRSARYTATLPVLLHHNGTRYAATIANIGEGGVMVSSNLSCSIGEPVVIRCGATQVLTTVAWARDPMIGLTFAKHLSASEVSEHLERSRAVEDRRAARIRANLLGR